MSTGELLTRLGAGVLLTGANAFFVVTEFALTRLRQFPEERFHDDRRLELAWRMTERLEIYLTGCQLGITSSSILLGVVAEPAVTWLLRPGWDAVGLTGGSAATASVITAVIVINLIHKIWGEQAPTYLGVERPIQVARWTAPIHFWWTRIAYPVIRLGDGVAKLTLRAVGVEMERSWTDAVGEGEEGGGEAPTDEAAGPDAADRPATRADLKREMGEALVRGGIRPDRRREVMRALEIQRIPVRDIMVPARDVVALEVGSPLDDILARVRGSLHSRFPLVDGDLESYRGTVYVPSILGALTELRTGEARLEDVAAPPLVVEADLPVSALIDFLQAEEQELAVVREDGRAVGLVTVTDAVEAIIGDLKDPLD
jgi:CBS domain containing-hemolysin-like protein